MSISMYVHNNYNKKNCGKRDSGGGAKESSLTLATATTINIDIK